jgi:integrase
MIDDFLAHSTRRGLRPVYLRALERTLRSYETEVGPVDQATADQIEQHLDRRQLNPASRAVKINHFCAFYRWAYKYGRLEGTNPADWLVRPKVPAGLPNPIAANEYVRALELADRPISTFLRLAGYAGLRACEIAPLRGEDISANGIYIRDGKGGKSRNVPCHPTIRVELAGYPTRGFLFPHPTRGGEPMTAHLVSDWVGRFFSKHEIDGTLHRCRHRFATELLRASNDLLLVQRLLGHANVQHTIRYTALVNPDGSDAVAAIA